MNRNSFKHRNRYYCFLFTCIMVLLLSILGLLIFVNWNLIKNAFKYFEKPKVYVSQQQKDFDNLFLRVQKLEELSKEYNSEDYQKRAIVYIRSGAYNDDRWNALGGSVDSDFEIYVAEHQGNYDLVGLKNVQTFKIPATNEIVDFRHMFAAMNFLYVDNTIDQNLADIGGWAGDLCQLVAEFKDSGLTGNVLLTAVKSSFNKSASSFASADVCADFDAVNIMNNYKNQSFNKSIFLSVYNYYNNLTNESRIQQFKNNVFETEYATMGEMSLAVRTRLLNNLYITALGNEYGINFTTHAEVINACIQVFVEYIY